MCLRKPGAKLAIHIPHLCRIAFDGSALTRNVRGMMDEKLRRSNKICRNDLCVTSDEIHHRHTSVAPAGVVDKITIDTDVI